MVKIVSVINTTRGRNLQEISLNLDSGEKRAIIGPNGAGKSTLVETLLNFIPSNYKRENKAISFKDVSYVSGKIMLPKEMIVSDYLKNILYLKTGKKDLKKSSFIFLIEKYLHKKTNNLSTGEERLIIFISAIIDHPKLLIIDEAFSNLDFKIKNILINLCKEMKSTTMLIISHDIQLLKKIADNYTLLIEGKELTTSKVGNNLEMELTRKGWKDA